MKILKGTDRKDRMRESADYPPVTGTEPPDWLIDATAVQEWRHKVGILTHAGVLTEADLSLLAQYCNMHASAVKQWRAGLAPTAAEMTQLRLIAADFGFTPASRSKVAVPKKKEKNPFVELAG